MEKAIFNGKSKHIETKFHFLKDHINKGRLELRLELIHCSIKDQVAHVFTMTLRQNRFERLRELLNVRPTESLV